MYVKFFKMYIEIVIGLRLKLLKFLEGYNGLKKLFVRSVR